jgi:two-component system KDP operon response regulator KdpE
MSAPLVLVIEDDASLRRFLRMALQHRDYQVIEAARAQEGEALARSHNPDVILMDLGLPDQDGLELLQSFRTWNASPIVVISARNQEATKVKALDAGADDYVTKPFGPDELMARLRVALRHRVRKDTTRTAFTSGPLKVDLENRRVQLHGQDVKLTPLEYKLLEALARREGRVATHAQLLMEVWGPSQVGQTHYLRIFMANLRKKLEAEATRPRILMTEPGVGYRMRLDEHEELL